ncbi:Phage integrase family [Oligella ureolytica]|uniref:Phage integrase family n=1 Tax=Oligella ureolytica TaxID=90244 RepID=A0A378XGS9_9BURK|nr:tyrosine-type recombinase/integrase [Oligella ureolytica]QPT41154.1 tyrosine-type recombinase/integrase [Oligella ureolytica]SUA53880.1 Phage integrase family [Oligella ureolytica]
MFLSDYTHGLFKSLKEITDYSAWCFPSKNLRSIETHVCLKSVSKQVGDRQALFKKSTAPLSGRAFNNDLVLAGGAHGKWTPHDLRRTGATMMQALGINLDVIDRCQNHIIGGSRVRRHYLHYDYREEKMDAWQKLGEQIMAILSS